MHRFWRQNYNATQKLTGARGDSCVLPCSSPVRGSTKTDIHVKVGKASFLGYLTECVYLSLYVDNVLFFFSFFLKSDEQMLRSFYFLSRALDELCRDVENRGYVNRLRLS